jgi:hypothetical protein
MRESAAGSTRDGMRWGLLLAAVAVSGYRLPGTFRNLQEWRATAAVDPLTAAQYKTFFTVNAVSILVIWGLAAVAFYFLRPRAAKPR